MAETTTFSDLIKSNNSAMDLKDLHLHWGECTYKGSRYRSYSLARSYREAGKNRKEVVIKLGKLTEDEALRWRYLLKGLKKPGAVVTTVDDLVVSKHYAYLDVAVASAIWDYWDLDEVFERSEKKFIEVSTIARILSINRCIDPLAKSKTPEWFGTTALSWLLNIGTDKVNSSRIFRELSEIEQNKEAICDHIYHKIKDGDPDSLDAVFYDLSSTTFSGSKCLLMKWGFCKEGYKNHVVLALVVNRDGLPFYWEVLPGCTADANTLVWLIERCKKRFTRIETTLVFDRGMVSEDNLRKLEEAGVKYITAMDRNQIEGITGIDFMQFKDLRSNSIDRGALKLPKFKMLNKDTTYYREIKVEGDRRYLLCFNPQLFEDQRQARLQAVEDFRTFVKLVNIELRGAKNSRGEEATYEKFNRQRKKLKLSQFVDVKLRIKKLSRNDKKRTIQTFQGTIVVDEEKMLSAGKLDGFWLAVTNHTEKAGRAFKKSAEEIIVPYREKTIIEAGFRDIKSFIQVEPVYVWTETHVKGHYTICVLGYLIDRTLTLRLHENTGSLTRDVFTHQRLFEKLSSCQIDKIEVEGLGHCAYNLTRPTKEQKELTTRIGLKNLLDYKVDNTSPF
jgi:transposase